MKIPIPRFCLATALFFVLLLPVRYSFAQREAPDSISTIIDTATSEDAYEEENETEAGTPISPIARNIPADSIRQLKNQPAFSYMSTLDSTLRAMQKARENQPPPPVQNEPENVPSLWDSGLVKLLCYLVAIGLVGFVLYKLFLGQGMFFRSRSKPLPAVELDEAPDETDLEKSLRQAMAKRDYRLAVRYLFLLTLNRLGEKGILQLSPDKTNYQYATELAGKPYASRFARLSLQYEYVWFGQFPIDEPQFITMQQQHQQFLKEI
jgi:hypothetical protein